MGPNGAGKSTLAYVMAGKAGYEVTDGEVLLEGQDLLALRPDERAARGVFLAFQYPMEIPGVATMTFLRTAINAQRKQRGEPELTTPEFMKKVRDGAGKLGIEQDMLRRGVNVGFSGGEKKRNDLKATLVTVRGGREGKHTEHELWSPYVIGSNPQLGGNIIYEPLAFYSAFADKETLWLAESYSYSARLQGTHRQDALGSKLERWQAVLGRRRGLFA